MVTYPVNWCENRLGDVCKYVNGTALEEYFSNYGNRRVISLGNYSEEGKYIDDGNRINLNQKTQSFLLFKDDLCMVLNDKGNGRLVGKVLFIDENDKYIFNQRSLRIIPEKNKVAPLFLYHLINSGIFRDRLKPHIQGNTQVYINPPAVMSIPIYLPSLQEQQAIASVLSDFDEHIDNLTELIEKKKAIREGALDDLLSGRTRINGFDVEWIESTIEDSTKEIITGGTPSTTVDKYWDGSIPWLASTEIHQKIITRATKNITKIGLNNSSAKMAPKDSVLIALAGQGKTRGTAAFLAYPMALNQSLAALVAADETDSKFLYYLIENMYVELRELSSGDGGRGGLNKTLIKNINIRLPREIKEQQAIASVLTAMDEEIESLKIEKDKMIQIKEGAMDDLLTGRVRLKV